jgi:hypothetical protein
MAHVSETFDFGMIHGFHTRHEMSGQVGSVIGLQGQKIELEHIGLTSAQKSAQARKDNFLEFQKSACVT